MHFYFFLLKHSTKQNSFVYTPIQYWLLFFLDVNFVNGLKHRFQRVKIAANNIEDVYDGALYCQKFAHGGILAEPYNISLKLNTDGVAIFRSSQFGVWPLFLLVNELPPLMR